LSPTALDAELRHEVAEAARAVAIAARHFRDGAVFQKDGTEGFVTAVQGLGGLVKEGFAEGVVHGSTLGNVTTFFRFVS